MSSSLPDASTAKENQQLGIIRVLPQEVIDRIKAGEVVQRPASAVKELLENALDAGSTEIVVTVTGRTFHKLTVSDNGCGISRADLPAAVQRHATSKLHTADDLQQLTTFGFRGEALASIAAVSQLSIVSRTADSTVAYQYSHHSVQQQQQQQQRQPKPCARSPGTTVTIHSLFYNLPQRQRKINSSEYMQVLQVVQHYAIHYAASGIAFICQLQGGGRSSSKQQRDKVDLNTRPATRRTQQRHKQAIANDNDITLQRTKLEEEQFEATKQVITQIYGAQVASCLLPFSSKLDESDEPAAAAATATCTAAAATTVQKRNTKKKSAAQKYGYDINNDDEDNDHYFRQLQATRPTYTCQGYVTNPALAGNSNGASSSNKRTTLILFCNHRLIECPPLKRRLEELYTNRFRCLNNSNNTKPWIFLSLHVPPQHVDVNVHPTKQQITLLHFDAIVQHLTYQLQILLASQGQSFVATAVPAKAMADESNNKLDKTHGEEDDDCLEWSGGKDSPQNSQTTRNLLQNPYKRSVTTRDSENNNQEKSSASSQNDVHPSLKSENAEKPKAIAPNKKIRTSWSTPTGALEPFLISTQSFSQEQTQNSSDISNNNTPLAEYTPRTQDSAASSDWTTDVSKTSKPQQHHPNCPFFLSSQSPPTLLCDLSQPGAFATAAAQCTCRRQTVSEPDAFDLRLPRKALIRPRKVIPTQCSYTSINQLRKRIQKKAWAEMKTKLRSACFVGVASHQRSLIQCEKELILMNHFECAKELFYQLALYRFCGGAQMARLDNSADNGQTELSGIDVTTVIADYVQVEELLQHMNEGSSSCSMTAAAASPTTVVNTMDLSTKTIKISETNKVLATQAAECLLEHAEMLKEYFSISFKKDEKTNRIMLTGLPVLLEDFEPLPDGLPLFLLRLATEVDWVEEKPCFHDVCRELGAYYAQLPHEEEQLGRFIRHVLFPAITTLLVPAERMKDDVFVTLTDLQKLYRVFERC